MLALSAVASSIAALAERAWRQRIDAIIKPDDVRPLSDRSLRDTIFLLGLLWAEIAALLCVANLLPQISLWWSVVVGLILVLLISTRINALNVVVHEGSHGFLAPSRGLNDRLTNVGAAWWTLSSVQEYRPTHRLHHRYLGEERDPDRPSYLIPERRGAFALLLLQDVIGLTAVRRGIVLVLGAREDEGATGENVGLALLGKVATQLVVLGQFVLIQGPLLGIGFYCAFWLFPLLCIFPLILRLKTITEHFDQRLRESGRQLWIARTSCAGWLQNHLLGARMEYHFEHHVLPNIPYRGLRELHRQLNDAGMFDQHAELLSGGYVRFLSSLASDV